MAIFELEKSRENIINKIISIDFDNISYKEAYKLLLDTSNSLKKIYKDS